MLKFRNAISEDSRIYFDWANDLTVREQSYNSKLILWEDHRIWFETKINDTACKMLVFQDELNNFVGQVRIENKNGNDALIGLSVAFEHRRKGYAQIMLRLASESFLNENPEYTIHAFIKEQNLNSKLAFEKAGFDFCKMEVYEGFISYHYEKKLKNEIR